MRDLDKFWALVVEVWTHGVGGVDVGKIIVGLLIFAGFLVIRGLFSQIVIFWLKKVAERTENRIDDAAIEALAPPFDGAVDGFG